MALHTEIRYLWYYTVPVALRMLVEALWIFAQGAKEQLQEIQLLSAVNFSDRQITVVSLWVPFRFVFVGLIYSYLLCIVCEPIRVKCVSQSTRFNKFKVALNPFDISPFFLKIGQNVDRNVSITK